MWESRHIRASYHARFLHLDSSKKMQKDWRERALLSVWSWAMVSYSCPSSEMRKRRILEWTLSYREVSIHPKNTPVFYPHMHGYLSRAHANNCLSTCLSSVYKKEKKPLKIAPPDNNEKKEQLGPLGSTFGCTQSRTTSELRSGVSLYLPLSISEWEKNKWYPSWDCEEEQEPHTYTHSRDTEVVYIQLVEGRSLLFDYLVLSNSSLYIDSKKTTYQILSTFRHTMKSCMSEMKLA